MMAPCPDEAGNALAGIQCYSVELHVCAEYMPPLGGWGQIKPLRSLRLIDFKI
jgi:hypothetical protein